VDACCLSQAASILRSVGPVHTKSVTVTSVISVLLRQETATWGCCDLGNSGVWERDYGWGVRVRRHLAHAEGVMYGMELGSVTLKRIGFFCFPIKHSTHTPSAVPSTVGRLGVDGFWVRDYGGGVRVGRPVGTR
jgi:hypothetical protein